jgi:hypothetical protein
MRRVTNAKPIPPHIANEEEQGMSAKVTMKIVFYIDENKVTRSLKHFLSPIPNSF